MAMAMEDDDVVMRKILWRVPMTALVRLKCVSKHWYALISSLQNQNKVLVMSQVVKEEDRREIETRFSVFKYPFFHDVDESCFGHEFQHSAIHGSSHGIVCFSNNYNDIFLYNPATRELRELPPSVLLLPKNNNITLPPWNPASVYYSTPPFINNNNNNTLPWNPSINNNTLPFQGFYYSSPPYYQGFYHSSPPYYQGFYHSSPPYYQGFYHSSPPYFQGFYHSSPPYFQGSYSSPSPILIPPNYNLSFQEDVDSITCAVGFGYDHKSGDLKVVRIVEFYAHTQDYSRPPRAEVYDLGKDGGWREIKTPIPANPDQHTAFDTYYQGCYYWWASGFRDELILWFHFSKEVFGIISMPEGLSYDKICTSLAVLNESIVLFNYPGLGNEKTFDLWKMVKDDDDDDGPEVVSWTKLFTIGPLLGIRYPLEFVSCDELLMVDNEGQLILCNIFNTQHCRRLPVKGKPASFQASLFVKTTLSLSLSQGRRT